LDERVLVVLAFFSFYCLICLNKVFFSHSILKYRERYKSAIDKCTNLEDELEKVKTEVSIFEKRLMLSKRVKINRFSLQTLLKNSSKFKLIET
jgi:hypothetical protein